MTSAVTLSEPELIVNGTCPHDCPDACGIQTRVRAGRAIEISGQAEHPLTAGWLCAKVAPYLERVYHPDRLLTPLKRIGARGSGDWQPISWPQAIDEIANRWHGIIERHGAEAILPYSYSGTLGLVQMTVASARFWNRLGASQLQRSICMAATRHAVRATLGARMSPPYHHLLDSSMGNQASLLHREMAPQVLLNPTDAAARAIENQQRVRLHNARGHCYRIARLSDKLRPGVAIAVNGYWADGELPVTINWSTSDALVDVARQSSFQTNRVWIEALQQTEQETQNE